MPRPGGLQLAWAQVVLLPLVRWVSSAGVSVGCLVLGVLVAFKEKRMKKEERKKKRKRKRERRTAGIYSLSRNRQVTAPSCSCRPELDNLASQQIAPGATSPDGDAEIGCPRKSTSLKQVSVLEWTFTHRHMQTTTYGGHASTCPINGSPPASLRSPSPLHGSACTFQIAKGTSLHLFWKLSSPHTCEAGVCMAAWLSPPMSRDIPPCNIAGRRRVCCLSCVYMTALVPNRSWPESLFEEAFSTPIDLSHPLSDPRHSGAKQLRHAPTPYPAYNTNSRTRSHTHLKLFRSLQSPTPWPPPPTTSSPGPGRTLAVPAMRSPKTTVCLACQTRPPAKQAR